MDSAVRSFIHRIDAGSTRFPDSYFDFICSNQVFEHIEDLDVVISELARIAKPSSIQVHLFPTLEVFIDGHTYVPFMHQLPRGMPRRMISRLWYYSGRARFGATTSSFHAWYAVFAAFLVEDTHYRSWPTIRSAFEQKFYIRRLDKDKLLGRLQLRSGLKFRLMTKIVQWVPDIVIGRVELYRSGIALELRKRNGLQRK